MCALLPLVYWNNGLLSVDGEVAPAFPSPPHCVQALVGSGAAVASSSSVAASATASATLRALPEYSAALTDFLLQFLSNLAVVVEESPPFPLPDFLHLLTKFTLAQPDPAALRHCLRVWVRVAGRAAAARDALPAPAAAHTLAAYGPALHHLAHVLLSHVQFSCNRAMLLRVLEEEEEDAGDRADDAAATAAGAGASVSAMADALEDELEDWMDGASGVDPATLCAPAPDDDDDDDDDGVAAAPGHYIRVVCGYVVWGHARGTAGLRGPTCVMSSSLPRAALLRQAAPPPACVCVHCACGWIVHVCPTVRVCSACVPHCACVQCMCAVHVCSACVQCMCAVHVCIACACVYVCRPLAFAPSPQCVAFVLRVAQLPTETTQLLAAVVPAVTGPLRSAVLAAVACQVMDWCFLSSVPVLLPHVRRGRVLVVLVPFPCVFRSALLDGEMVVLLPFESVCVCMDAHPWSFPFVHPSSVPQPGTPDGSARASGLCCTGPLHTADGGV